MLDIQFQQNGYKGSECESIEYHDSCKLLAAAVISQQFREQLLSNPQKAVETGYGGQSFEIGQEYKNKIVAIKATNLTEFACQFSKQIINHNSITPCFAGD
ncbi:MAG: hypothetical protein CVU39_05810 [Chloroflexi bacterium HGW-Chloroflexi-10]|jgi:hypothetical protein|nr:MAG: hypothetical protein CVU39_05810 [Chloroflexi bacterium HGW-Chloroflexi-10]